MSPCIFSKRDGSTDPVAHAIAETLFWAEQMKEHAAFFIMLMPGDALADLQSFENVPFVMKGGVVHRAP